jgi:hypothetical protein
MKKWVLAAAAAICVSGTVQAAVVTLEDVSANGANDFTFNYQGTLGADEGLRSGDRLIIYDFAGYIDNSIFSSSELVTASVELSSTSGVVHPGFTDDPTLANLVFTYNRPDFRNEGGPFAASNFDGLGARSTFGGRALDAFFTLTTKNNPDNVPGGSNTAIYTLGSVAVPSAAIPEPAAWAMMLGGFGLIGAASRRRARTSITYA